MKLQKAETPKFTPFTLTIENEQDLRLLAILVRNSGCGELAAINLAMWNDMCRSHGVAYIFNLSLDANGCIAPGIDLNKF